MKKRTGNIRSGKAAGFATGIIAAVICICTVGIYALADTSTGGDSGEGPSSNLWLSVVDISETARISVTVPTAYSFMVVGTVETADTRPVTIENGGIQLGRKVVWSEQKSAYDIVVEDARVEFKNYSTDVVEQGADSRVRAGVPVTVKGYIGAEPVSKLAGTDTWWQPVEEEPTGNIERFKCYRMGIGKKWFEIPGTVTENGGKSQVLYMSDGLKLEAPDLKKDGCDVGGTAKTPSCTYYNVELQVGGVRNNYNVPEESVKAGRIVWEVDLIK